MWFQGKRDGPGAYTSAEGRVINGAWKNDSLYLNYDYASTVKPKATEEEKESDDDWQKSIILEWIAGRVGEVVELSITLNGKEYAGVYNGEVDADNKP